jgi:hypothetical protein
LAAISRNLPTILAEFKCEINSNIENDEWQKKNAEFINYTMKVKFLGVRGKLQEFLRVWGKKGKPQQ